MRDFLSELRNGRLIMVGEHTKFFLMTAPCGAYLFPLKDQHALQRLESCIRSGLTTAPENFRHGHTSMPSSQWNLAGSPPGSTAE